MKAMPKPAVRIYRADDASQYLVVELASVDAGHYVAWGTLHQVSAEQMSRDGWGLVLHSLRSFRGRNGNDPGGRLRMRFDKPLNQTHDPVVVELLVETDVIAVTPLTRGNPQSKRLDDQTITCGADGSAAEFWDALQRAFGCGAGPSTA